MSQAEGTTSEGLEVSRWSQGTTEPEAVLSGWTGGGNRQAGDPLILGRAQLPGVRELGLLPRRGGHWRPLQGPGQAGCDGREDAAEAGGPEQLGEGGVLCSGAGLQVCRLCQAREPAWTEAWR